MLKSKVRSILLSVSVLWIISLACAVSGISTPSTQELDSIGTVAAATIYAGLTQTARSVIPVNDLASPTSTLTFTPAIPTDTPTQTLSPTPLFTSTPLVPQISVSVATNCRTGPGKAYERVGALLVGEVAQVFGRDLAGNYWYIRNPDATNDFCWVWGEYATLSGYTLALPIFTPPPSPTPTPDFKISYAGLDSCVGWWTEYKLENIGDTTFKSISLTVKDMNTNTSVSMDANGFTNIDGCISSNTEDTLPVEKTRRVSAPAFVYDPSGHKLHVTITLCTDTEQAGTCTSDVIEFKP